MDDLLSVILQIERKLLCSYLFKQELSNEEFKLWSNGLKPVLMDQHLEILEEMMCDSDCFVTPIRCRRCKSTLEWIPSDYLNDNIDEINWICIMCHHSQPILKCNSEETCNILVDLIDKEHPQIIASAINLVLIGGNVLNSMSPPIVPDNPIAMVQSMYEQSPSALKFGGTSAVIIADIYEDIVAKEFPILYIADTVSIPTRYYLHALKYLSIQTQLNNNNSEYGHCSTSVEQTNEEILLKELIDIANCVIKSGSYLVLGPKLQHLISPDAYNKRRHNLAMVIPFDELKPLDNKSTNSFDVADNFDKICKPAMDICSIVYLLVCHAEKKKKPKTGEALYNDLQKHLSAAIWLKTFSGTPFEALLYHILGGNSETPTN